MTRVQELMNKIEEVKAEAKELKTATEINAKIQEIEDMKAQLKIAEMEEADEKAEIENKIREGKVQKINKSEDDDNMKNDNNVGSIMAKALVGTATNEELGKIQNLMSEGEDSKGGLTVPADVKTQIIELQRKSFDIRKYINVEPTKVKKGNRVVEIGEAQATGFASVDEGKEIQALHEPTLGEVEYSIRKYAGYIPVTNELLEDSSENILAYINKWMAKNELNTYAYQVFNGTGNKACEGIMTEVAKKDGKLKDRVEKVDLTNANAIKKFKTVLNKDLDEVDTDNIVIFTNADGYDYVDGLEDKNGRPLLQEDVTKASGYKFLNKEIVKVPSKFLANVTDSADTKVPFIVGDLKLLYTMYDREQMGIESTKIGGDAWRSDKTEIKGSFRFDGKINGDVKAVKVLLAKLG